VNLTYAKAPANVTTLAPTRGRGVDHIGFEIKGLEAFCKKAEANGVKFDVPFALHPELGISQAFLKDEWGNSLELTEGLFHSTTEVHYYSAERVAKTFAKDPTVRPGGANNGRAGVLLGFKDNPPFQVTIRRHDEENEPEVHEDHWHIFYVLEGNATFVTGGKEVGKELQGGQTVKLEKGSIIVVPSGIVHWFKAVPNSPWLAFGVEYHD
jgi:mannose-6-phosphate isomerase-like protein (cupin superfamily)